MLRLLPRLLPLPLWLQVDGAGGEMAMQLCKRGKQGLAWCKAPGDNHSYTAAGSGLLVQALMGP